MNARKDGFRTWINGMIESCTEHANKAEKYSTEYFYWTGCLQAYEQVKHSCFDGGVYEMED